jgi:crossover junction endodeoxyribonuclease RuvC
MRDVRDRITEQIGTPDLVVMETPAFSRSGGGAHERAWLWWELYGYLATHHIPTALMGTGQRCTYATGKGNASKEAVVDAVARRWPAWETQGDNNLADAVVFMAAGLDWSGHPITAMPKTHRAAIDKATWPNLTPTGAIS